MGEVLVVVEHRQRELTDISLEMLSKGRLLADQSQNALCAVVVGDNIQTYTSEVAKWADTVIAVTDKRIQNSLAEPYQKIVYPIIQERNPRLVLIGHSSFGMDLAPALAIEVNAPLATDCIDILIENENVSARRSIYNGKVDALYSFSPSETAIVTGRFGQFPIEESQRNGAIEVRESPLKEAIDYKQFVGYLEPEVGDVDITQSNVLVAVGRGIKDEKNLSLAKDLATLLGGEVASSRPVVDYGWLPNDRQVGLSGKIVKPDLYLALGISGAIQHLAGITGAGKIIAINKDPEAPIFNVADYGIVDDIFNVVPLLIDKLRGLKHGIEDD